MMMTRTVKDPQERRAEIIETARQLFQDKGYERTTMQDVMDTLEIAKGTIYHYFASKEELLEAVVEGSAEAYITRLTVMLAEMQGNALERMRALILAAPLAEQEGELLEPLHQAANMGMHTRQLAVAVLQMSPLYEQVIAQGVAEGTFHTAHPREAAEMMLAGVQFLVDSGIYPWSVEDLQRRVLAMPALVESILGAPAGSFSFLTERIR